MTCSRTPYTTTQAKHRNSSSTQLIWCDLSSPGVRIQMLGFPSGTDTTGERRKARLLRRWITLLPAGWLPPEKRPSASLYRRRSPWRALPSWIEGSHAHRVIRDRRGWTGHSIYRVAFSHMGKEYEYPHSPLLTRAASILNALRSPYGPLTVTKGLEGVDTPITAASTGRSPSGALRGILTTN